MRAIATAALLGATAVLVGAAPAAASPSCQLCVVVEDAARSEYRASSGPILDTGRMLFEVRRGIASGTITVPWEIVFNGSASSADVDITSHTGTVTLTAGDHNAYISVPIVQDTIAEPNHTFSIVLGDPSGNYFAEDRTAVGTILDDDPAKVSAINARAVSEAGGPMKFAIRLSRPLTTSVTVSYNTDNGTATSADYYPTSGTVVFAPGQTAKTIDVVMKDDSVYHEPDETVWLRLHSVTGAPVADAAAVGVIEENDYIG